MAGPAGAKGIPFWNRWSSRYVNFNLTDGFTILFLKKTSACLKTEKKEETGCLHMWAVGQRRKEMQGEKD